LGAGANPDVGQQCESTVSKMLDRNTKMVLLLPEWVGGRNWSSSVIAQLAKKNSYSGYRCAFSFLKVKCVKNKRLSNRKIAQTN
jgi:hypothetical protein